MSAEGILIIAVSIMAFFIAFIFIIIGKVVHTIESDIRQIVDEVKVDIKEGLSYSAPTNVPAYGTDLPTTIPPSPDFDLESAQFDGRVIMSLVNKTVGNNPLFPPQFQVIGEIGDNQVVLLRRPQSGAPATPNATGPFFYVLAFRGTITSDDLQADLTVGQVAFADLDGTPVQGAMVHRGFYEVWIGFKQQLIQIRDRIQPGDTIMITGHSEGSALASLTAYDYAQHIDPSDMSFYVYESPRYGNDVMVRAVENAVPNHWYIRNVNDIIPDLPPSVTPLLGQLSLYADPQREYLVDLQTGNVGGNHDMTTNICALDPTNPVPECPTDFVWVNLPQIPILAEDAGGLENIGDPVTL